MNTVHGMTLIPVLGLTLLAVCADAAAQEKPGKLRSEMAKAEKEYFDLYNKLNTDPQFAIVCRMETPTGSNFATRVCQPRYLLSAKEKSATERMQAATAAGTSTGSSSTSGPTAGLTSSGSTLVTVQDKDEAFRQNLLAVQQKSPELQALGKKRDDLQARYAEATKGK